MHYSFMNYAYDVDCMLSEVQVTSSIKCDFLGVFMTNFMIFTDGALFEFLSYIFK